MFMIDVAFATVGYVLTMKPLDAHIRTANPYAAGWTAALICYPPFILMGDGGPLDYHSDGRRDGWTYWLADYPLLMALVGAWLVFLTAIYAWATVAFGFRFSNLTHRGILTHGPYAWTKHPAYLSKNLFWWLAVLPFLATTGNLVDMVRNTVDPGHGQRRLLLAGADRGEAPLRRSAPIATMPTWMERNGPMPRLISRLKPRRERPAGAGRGRSGAGSLLADPEPIGAGCILPERGHPDDIIARFLGRKPSSELSAGAAVVVAVERAAARCRGRRR